MNTLRAYRILINSLMIVLMLIWQIGQPLLGASATWDGTTDGTWATGTNWSMTPAPGTGDTATFNNLGSGNTILDLGAGVTINTILFNSANVGAYTIGSGALNSQTLNLNDSGAVTMNSTVAANHLFNAALTLGTATAGTYTLTNNSLTNGLTFAGTISGGAGGVAAAKTLNVSGAGNTAISGAIGNGGASALALTKFGSGILTLSGINAYTGPSTVQGGTLALDANTGNGSIAGAALTFSGGGGTFNYLGAATGSAQAFSGALTFSAGAANVQSSYGTSGNTSLTFASLVARTAGATGNFVVSGGANGTTNKIVLTAQATGFINQGTFFNGADYAYYDAGGFVRGINYGTDASTATVGTGATIGALSANHVQVTGLITAQTTLSINTLKLSGANTNFNLVTSNTLTLSNGGLLKAGGGTSIIGFAAGVGTITAGATELVIRADASTDNVTINSLVTGSGGVTVTGTGTVNLNNTANTFTGAIRVNGGTLAWNGAAATNDALGASTSKVITLTNGGVLRPTSSYNPATTTKTFVIGTGSGTFNAANGVVFTLDDAGQFGGTGDLTVTGEGTGRFDVGNATASAYTGNVRVNSGTLRLINGVGALGTTAAGRTITVANGGSMELNVSGHTAIPTTLSGAGVINAGALHTSLATAVAWASPITLASNTSIGTSAAGSLTLTGGISGTGDLTRIGAGTGALILSGTNTYTGATKVGYGSMTLDFSNTASPTTNIVSTSSALNMGVGTATGTNTPWAGIASVSGAFTPTAILNLTGKASTNNEQTFNGTTLTGGSAINATAGAIGNLLVNLGALSRNAGGTVNFVLPNTGAATATNALTATGVLMLNNAAGILGGWATVGSGTTWNWAVNDGSGNIAPYSGSYVIPFTAGTISSSATSHIRLDATSTGNIILAAAGTTDVNTIQVTDPLARTIDIGTGNTLRLGLNGAIWKTELTATAANVTIGVTAGQGILTAGGAANTASELIILTNGTGTTNNAASVAINAVIADNGTGAVTLVKGGSGGGVTLNATSTYTGGTYINQGRVAINAIGAALGTGPVTILPNGQLFPTGGTIANDINIAGLGTTEGVAMGAIRNDGATFTGVITLAGDTRLGSNGGTGTYNGKITGAYNLEFANTIAATMVLGSTLNDFSGNLAINGLNASINNVAATVRLGASNVIPDGAGKGNVIITGGATAATFATLNLFGFNETINGLISNPSQPAQAAQARVTNTGTVASTLTVGGNNVSSTYNGVFQDASTGGQSAQVLNLVKIGTGTLTLGGAITNNTATGAVTVSGGSILVNSAGALGAFALPSVSGLSFASNIGTFNIGGLTGSTNLNPTDLAGQTVSFNAGNNNLTYTGVLSGGGSFTKSGTGTQTFTAGQLYSGGTTISGGFIRLFGASAGITGAITLNGGALILDNGATFVAGNTLTVGASGGGFLHRATNNTDLTAATTSLAALGGAFISDVELSTNTVTYVGAFSGAGGINKVGAGSLRLQGGATGQTYLGTTTVGAGTLQLDFTNITTPANGVITGSTAFAMRGGTLNLIGKASVANVQSFSGTTLTEGGSTISATLGTATSVTANLGVIGSRATGSAVHFALPNTTTTLANVSTTAANTSGILGGWATYGTTAGVATSWAAKDGSNNIIALADGTYTTLTAAGGGTAATTNFTVSLAALLTVSPGITANSLRITAGGNTLALGTNNMALGTATSGISSNVGAGGILYSATTGTGTITGTTGTTAQGFINVPVATGDLPIYVSTGGTLSIGAGIGGTITAFGITKSGGGTLILNNAGTTANNYTGATVINGGTVQIDAANRLGGSTTPSVTLNGGQFNLNFTTSAALTTNFSLGLSGGAISNSNGGNVNISNTGALTLLGNGSRTLNFAQVTDRVGIFQHTIGDQGGPTSLGFNLAANTSVVQLNGISSYTGNTTISRGIVRLNAVSALGSSNVVFAGTANRSIIELTTASGSFTNTVGTQPGQIQWATNAVGGFSAFTTGATLAVNLGGAATPQTVTWGSGGFVNGTGILQFAQTASNTNYSNGTVDFQNPIDLAGATRTIDVADGGNQNEVTLSGLISGAASSILNKTGVGNITLTANNTTSTNVGVSVTSGSVIFPTTNAIPGTTGATVTVNAGGSVVLTGSANPMTAIGSRIATGSAGAIALDTNSSATLDFSTPGFTALALGALNTSLGTPVIFTGSIIPNTQTYRLASGRSNVWNSTATTGSAVVNFAASGTAATASNILVLPNTNQLPDGGGARSLVVGAGVTYLSGYNTFTGGTRIGLITGQAGNAVLGIGNDAALGAGLIQMSPTGTTAGLGYLGGLNGDHFITNNVTVGQAGNWVAAANLASDGVSNSGAMTYAGTTTLTGAVNIFARTSTAIFLGDIAATGAIAPQTTGAVSFLTTPTGAANKSFNQAVSIAIGGNLIIDSNASLGSGTNTLTIGTGTAAATNTFLRVQAGTSNAVTLTGRAVTIGTNFQPIFDVPGGPVTGVTSNLVLPGVVSGSTTALIGKIGTGTLTLRGANTFNGTNANGLQIFGGTVLVDTATVATSRATSSTTTALTLGTTVTATAATLGGGGTFTLSAGGNAGAQTFTVLQVGAKDNTINLNATGGSSALTFNGATFNRGASGGTLAINTTGTASITLSGTVTSGATTINQIILDEGTTGNAFAYINGTDWAARNGTTGIIALPSGSYTANTATVLAGNADMTVATATTTLAAPTTITSLRFNAAAAETLDVNASALVTGGILVGTGAGAFNQVISATGAGTLAGTGGAFKDLVIINANTNGDGITTGLLTISAPIINNGAATTLTKSGPGTLVLSGANTFTSSIFINGGVLSVATAGSAAAPNPLGQMAPGATNLIMNGGTLRYTGASSTTTDRGATFNSYSTINVDAGGGTPGSGTLVMSGPLSGIATPGLLQKTGAGSLSLSGGGDNANLSVLMTAGTLNLDKSSTSAIRAIAGAGGSAALVLNGGTVKITGTGGDQISNPSSVVVNGGIFDFNGWSETFDALGGTGGTVTNTGASAVTLTLGDGANAGSQANNSANTPNAAAAGVAAAGLNSYNGVITDDGTNFLSINKAGPGMQILTGTTKTYGGTTTVTSGVLRLGAQNVLPSGVGKGNVSLVGNTVIFGLTVPGTLDMGGFDQALNGLSGSAGSVVTNTSPTTVSANQTNTLQLGNNDQTSQFDGIFQDGYVIKPGTTPVGYFGSLAVEKVGAGVLTLTGTNTNTGAVTIQNGRIDLNNATGNALSTAVTINTGGTLKLIANNQVADARTVTTSGGAFDLNGRTETVGVVLTSGSITDGAGGGALSSNSAFDLRAGTVSAKLSGTSGLNKSTGGTVTLGGSQTHDFTGATAISAGTLQLSTGASLSLSSGVALTGSGKLFVNGSSAAGVPISVASGTTLGGTGTVSGTVTVSAAGGIIEAGQSSIGSLSVGTINFGGPGTINLFNLNTVTASILDVATALTTTAGLGNKVTINLTNSGSLDGTTNYGVNGYKLIDVGTLSWGASNNNFVLGTITGLGGRSTGTLNFVDNDALYMTVAIVNPIWSGAQSNEWSTNVIAGSKNWYLPPSTPTDYIDLPNPDTVLFDDTATTSVVDITVGNVSPNGVTFDFGNAVTNYTLQGTQSIIGSTNLVKSGTGTLTINNANSFTGGVVINGGVVKLGNASALGTANTLTFGPSASAGTKLQLFGTNDTVTGLSTNATPGSPVVENGDATTDSVLTVNLASGTNTFAGVLQDGAAAKLGLAKQGGGTLILTGANMATGGNTVSVGTLQIGAGGTAGSLTGDTSVAGSAILAFNRSDTLSTHAGGVTGAGAVSILGGGTLSVTGNVAHTGGTTIAASTTLKIGAGGATGALSGTGAVANSGTLAFDRTGSTTVQAVLNGSGNLSVGNGVTGTLILTGNNGYLGATTINSLATLQVGNGAGAGTLGTAASITNNGTFAYGRSDAQTYATIFNGTGALRVLDGALTLSGNNNTTYSGGTTVDSGASLIVGNIAGTAGAIPGLNASGTGSLVADGNVTFRRTGSNTFDNTISGASSGEVTLAAGSWTLTGTTSYAGSTTIQSGATLNIAAGSGTGVGPGTIGNTGTLVFNRTATYTLGTGNLVTGAGAVTLANTGAVTAAVNNQFNTTGVLNLGAAQGSTTAVTLDLGAFDSTFGSLNVMTNTATANVVNIGAGKTLTLTGGVAGVVTIGANSAANTTTNVNFAGGGNLVVTRPGGTFQVGGATGATNYGNQNVNLSGLTNFTVDLGATGLFRVADQASGSATSVSTLTGAANSSITTGTLSVGDSTGFGTGTKSINFGSGTNTINANIINLGDTNNGNSARGSGLIQFAGASGALTIRSATGAIGTANINMVNTASTTGTQLTGQLLLAAHSVDVNVNAITMAARSGSTTQGADSTLTFDQGTLTANTLSMVSRTGITLTSGASTGTVTIGGGTATLGAVTMVTNSVTTAVSTGAATATLNINGGGSMTITSMSMANSTLGALTSTSNSTATVNIGTISGAPTVALGTVTTMARNGSAATSSNTASGRINVAAGAVTATSIAMADTTGAASANDVATALLSITGGSLTLAGNITTINGPGTENTTLTLNGGLLNMAGNNIGAATAGSGATSIGTLNFQSGTLQNVAQINGGAGLTKSAGAGTNTLILEGTNTYTGNTVVSSGTLQLGSGLATGSMATTSPITVAAGATFAVNQSDIVTQGTEFSSAVITGAGGFAQTGSGTTILNNTNSYTGTTTVSGGTLQVGDGTSGSLTGSGNVNVTGAGTKLSGSGSIAGSVILGTGTILAPGTGSNTDISNRTLTFTGAGAAVEVQDGAQIQLGLSSSTKIDSGFNWATNDAKTYLDILTVNGTDFTSNLSYTTNWKNAESTYDSIKLSNGTFNLGQTAGGTIKLLNNSASYSLGNIFKLLDWSTLGTTDSLLTGSGGFDISYFNLSSVLPGTGLSWDTSAFSTYGVIVVIPEPSRALLMLIGLLALGFRRRRND